jgi:MFS family permease
VSPERAGRRTASPALAGFAAGFSPDARRYLACAAILGFTLFGGIYPLLTNLYYLRLGYDLRFIGFSGSVVTLGWALGCLPAGLVGRRLGSRRSMLIGLGVAMVGYVLMPLAEAVPASARAAWLVATRLAANIALSLYDVNTQPFLVEASTPQERDRLFAVQSALWPLSAFAGSLLGGVLPLAVAAIARLSADDPACYRYPLLLAAATLAIGIRMLSAIHSSPAPTAAAGGKSHGQPRPADPAPPAEVPRGDDPPARPAAAGLSIAAIVFVGAVMLLQSSAEGASRSFFTVYLDTRLRTPSALIGLISGIGQLAAVPAALAMPLAVRWFGHRGVFAWGTVVMALGLLPAALVAHPAAVGLSAVAVTAMVSLTRPALMVYLMGVVQADRRAALSGVFTMAIGLGWSATALAGGIAIGRLGFPMFFASCAVLSVSAAAIFAVNRIGQRRETSPRTGFPSEPPRRRR